MVQNKNSKVSVYGGQIFRGGGTALIADKIYVISYGEIKRTNRNKGDYVYV